MSEDDVDRVVLKPMRAMFPPPRHLRADEDAHDAALREYRRALSRFDEQVLERAWRQVVARHEYWCWPKLPDLLHAAEQAQRELRPKVQAEGWVERATKLSDDYVKRFLKTSAIAARAREGDYERELKRYVEAASWVQAQMIVRPGEGLGYDHYLLFGKGPRDREAEQEWFRKAREQAASGQIKVRIPPAMLKQWQAEAGQERSR